MFPKVKENCLSLNILHITYHIIHKFTFYQGTYIAVDTVPEKAPGTDNEDDDEECMDWWTKYFASIDTMIEVINSSI